MGWGRYLLLGNLGQQLDLSDQARDLEDLRAELNRSRQVCFPPATSRRSLTATRP